MINEKVLDKLRKEAIKRAGFTHAIHYVVYSKSKGTYSIVNSDNTLLGADAEIDFIGFRFSDVAKLKAFGTLL